jgi:hypothetical protein
MNSRASGSESMEDFAATSSERAHGRVHHLHGRVVRGVGLCRGRGARDCVQHHDFTNSK